MTKNLPKKSENKVVASYSNPANAGLLKELSDKGIHINIKISNDLEITKLNKKYFDRDFPTDVLSFNLNANNPSNSDILGEIIVNYDQAVRQSHEYSNDVEHEISELVAHGVLHILGVHHPEDDDTSVHGVPINKEPIK